MTGLPVAVIDCGTNTIRLLIAESDGDGGLIERDRWMQIVRLGQGVDATGAFHPEALERTFAATETYAELIKEQHIPTARVRFVATSATRDVSNREAFFTGIRDRLGVGPEVITGDEEARLSFTGALAGADHPAGPVLVTDIGGGSTELIMGGTDGRPTYAISLDIGSVRITERFWTADPPAPDDLAAAAEHIDGLLDTTAVDWPAVGTWIGVAGTLTTLAAIDLGLTEYDRSLVHGHRIALPRLQQIAADLSHADAEQIRATGTVHPQRADVITAGALIAARIAARLPVDTLTVSESDILDGCALGMLSAD